MLTKFRQTRRAFTTVEILVAVGLVAILMVVAVPRLLDSRKTVSDSSAKQQLNTVMLSINNFFAERDSYKDLSYDELKARVPEIELVDETFSGKGTGGRALTVSYKKISDTTVVIAAGNGEDNCWGIEISTSGTKYYGAKVTPCAASSLPPIPAVISPTSPWQSYEFPPIKES